MSARPLPGRATAAASPATLAVSEGREFAWTNADFSRVQKLIYQRAGISLHDGKHAMVYSRLSRRLRQTGYRRFGDYLDGLEACEAGDGESEIEHFVNALTTNLTSFFREPHHFAILAELLKARRGGEPWNLWCSAASTGEEAYSMAITAAEALGSDGGGFRLVASDIDSRVLAKAVAGVYRAEQVKDLSAERLRRFFLRGKAGTQGMVRVKPELQRLVEFRQINLVSENWPFSQAFDVVFCRNVMIYFDTATQRKVLEHMHRMLRPGGLLMAGHAENFSEARDLFKLQGKTVYVRL